MTARADVTRELEQKRVHLSNCKSLTGCERQFFASMKVTALELNRMYEGHMAFRH